jgi:hypothetical protein
MPSLQMSDHSFTKFPLRHEGPKSDAFFRIGLVHTKWNVISAHTQKIYGRLGFSVSLVFAA